ncbi:hypothetical protein COT75_00955 [Candidatus Beckwithbacteria bacterium CG10_big_fil_rev_8_21_14_0_10_34_10]|uniref:Beta-lactamase n=1 Tax=Candidatus Beckwithbacteria bacterium CG10_big_fil_rev_8_21_14_0_10_34_10 TaxID=1974495 RepID=A0A2H0WAH9_9BACT|nr:MAG: hypothetical protein COT75_00955 [Candidatus Beckwithbacteria bacterium CG10_big_fil_rev_8_21_14_0_10_34_10]
MRLKPIYFKIFLSFIFFFLLSRLFYLQIVKGEENLSSSRENRIKLVKTPALRGVIYDTEGKILVRNQENGRYYLYPQETSHLLGYVGEATEEEIKKYQLSLGDLIGKMGIEKQYDDVLRGKNGGVLIETDALGNEIREVKKIEPQTGTDIYLNLNLDLQKKALDLLKDKKGAIIVTQPKTGAVLALVSSPSFNPNLFTLKAENEDNASSFEDKRNEEITKLFENSAQPMFNRAIAGLYPPGSTFKIVTAIAGLEEKKISKETKVEDTGEIKVGEYTYGNWYFRQYGQKEGELDLVKAIQRSNDIYFYKVGEWLGIGKLNSWSKYFGLGQKSEIDLPFEASGLVPSPRWKKEVKTEGWYLGDTYITAIGQGNLQLTPLQVNQLSSVIAANGQLCQPTILKSKPSSCLDLKIKLENLDLVKKGMIEVCQKGGTAFPFFDFPFKTACKTGTAEIGLKEDEKTHAWFTVFAPADNPEVVMTVLIEEGGEGSADAAPLAKALLEYWFKDKF